MLVLIEFFVWWYGRGWRQAAEGSINLIKKVQLTFSMAVLVRTLFSPWKQIVSIPGRSLEEKMRAMLDNFISRIIGFFVRFFVLGAAAFLVLGAALAGLVMTLAWPFIPLLIVFFAFRGLAG